MNNIRGQIKFPLIIISCICVYVSLMVVDFIRSQSGYRSEQWWNIVAGSLPNVISVLFGSALLYVIFYGPQKDMYPIGYTIGAIFYELLQLFINGSTFDYYDLLGSLLGYIIYFSILKRLIDFLAVIDSDQTKG